MHSNRTCSRRIIVLADRDPAMLDAHERQRLEDAVADGHVLVVAPAGPVAGERWIVDLSARRAQAEDRLRGWATMLARHASELELEVGDANPRLALSDARGPSPADAVIRFAPLAEAAVRSGAPPARLPGRPEHAGASRMVPSAA
jgi:hypothetical protein